MSITGRGTASRPSEETWRFCLYVAGQTSRTSRALERLRRICDTHLTVPYEISVVDILMSPEAARAGQIVAVPAPA